MIQEKQADKLVVKIDNVSETFEMKDIQYFIPIKLDVFANATKISKMVYVSSNSTM